MLESREKQVVIRWLKAAKESGLLSRLEEVTTDMWVTNPENLTAEQRGELEKLKRKFPELGRLAEHREALRRIFEDRSITDPAVAIKQLGQWCQRGAEMGLNALRQFNKTLENWMDKIANYFVSRSSNGRTEGFNRSLRTILWRACGMRNFSHFRLRVLHQFGSRC